MAWGRVALLYAAAEPTKNHLDEVAKIVVYRSIAPSIQNTKKKLTGSICQHNDENQPEESVTQHFPEMIFWQITKITTFKQPDNEIPSYMQDKHKAAQFNSDQKRTFVFEAPKPLTTLTQLTPLLINSLGRKVKNQQLDCSKVVRCISQGKPIQKMSYQQQIKWPLQLTVLVDKHHELYPYWSDFDHIVKQLQIQLGKGQVQVITLHERNMDDWLSTHNNTMYSSVLILSDLADQDNNHRYWAWQDILTTVQKQIDTILTLSPANKTTPTTALSRKASINSLTPAYGFIRHAKKQGFTIPIRQSQLEMALTMISPLALVDSGLLRKLRCHFNWGNPALEGLIWNDDRIEQSFMGIRLQTNSQEMYRSRFSQLTEQIQEEFWLLVEEHHKKAYPGLLNLERTSKMALSQTTEIEEENTIAYLQSLLAHYHLNISDQQHPLNAQLKTLINFIPQSGWSSSAKLSDLLHQAYALAYQDEIRKGDWNQSLPEGFDLNKIQPLLEQVNKPEQHPMYLQMIGLNGEAQVFQGVSTTPAKLINFSVSDTYPGLLQNTNNDSLIPLKPGQIVVLDEEQTIFIKTATRSWQIKGIKCPDFAQNIGQDQQGLFIETELNNPKKRYYWLPEEEDENHNRLKGAWLPESGFAEKIRQDQYGLYTDITINNITQCFRYIAPGSVFLMGSPEDETGRETWSNSKETQHQVTLTDGFWLADTTVTQALYQAVMGENPSYFTENLNNPVEQVSWNDAQLFIEKLNIMIPELNSRLPSEAQWEYACRAGTTTPFSLGENITPEQVNYAGDFPYAKGIKSLISGNTVAVKSLPANPWGLYEMHGNVWEWCEDCFHEDLGNKPLTDPLGKGEGAVRVMRGGSWNDSARNVRSAIRFRRRPDFSLNNIGFRLSLGLELQPGHEQTDPAGAIAEGRSEFA